jgi:hypothetical protein
VSAARTKARTAGIVIGQIASSIVASSKTPTALIGR